MNSIKDFIENMFFGIKQSPDVLKAKEELGNMMEDKYDQLIAEGKSEHEALGQVISEFGDLEELAGDLGIEEELSSVGESIVDDNINSQKMGVEIMTTDEAENFLREYFNYAKQIALGVLICIASSIFIIAIGGYYESKGIEPDNLQLLPGIIAFFIAIVIGVGFLIVAGIGLSKWSKLDMKLVSLPYSYTKMLEKRKEEERKPFAMKIVVGVALIIIAIVLVLTFSALYEGNQFVAAIGVSIMILLIAFAVAIFILAGMRMDAYNRLLNLGDYTVAKMREDKVLDNLSTAYWLLVIAGYLIWSFTSYDWDRSWIVWPIAGILWVVLRSIITAFTPVK